MRVGVLVSSEAMARSPGDGPTRLRGNSDIARLLSGPGCEVETILVGTDDTEPGRNVRLPPCDVVVNAIAEPDVCRASLALLGRRLAEIGPPVLNRPEGVARTRRDRLADQLAANPALCCPRTIRLACAEPRAFAAAAAAALAFPVLARPAGSHRSQDLALCRTEQALAEHASRLPPGAIWYVTAFVDNRGEDGLYHKMRMFVVGDRYVPRHRLAADDWNVHVGVRDTLMRQRASLRDAERAFLEAPETVLGRPAWDGLAAIREAVGLDIFGIDFALLPDGRVLLFEASANMVMGPSRSIRLERFAYARAPAARLRAAVLDLLERRIAAAQGR